MNWFDTSGLTSLAKTALKEAQKTIDKALDIQDESEEEQADQELSEEKVSTTKDIVPKDNSDFFASWGLAVSGESPDAPVKEQPVVTESPSKSTSQSLWGSFAGSFFEQPKDTEPDTTIVRPPKAKSMNLISDSSFGSNDDLFSKSQLVMSDGADVFDVKKDKFAESPNSKEESINSSSQLNRLSLVSSFNSSDSVEVLSHSLKTTPDSEAASAHSESQSSSTGPKQYSESVEVLPDSLVSPSSIECLGFDSYSSDKIVSSSSSMLLCDISDRKSTPVAEKDAETADSVSLVADDDEDTISYNSVSECTAPTVLDTEDKPISPFSKIVRTEPQKKTEKDLLPLEPLIPQRMQMSENSSNDGSWSDRTLNADNDSITLDTTAEEQKKEEVEQEDNVLMEKLSDSSSFYNVNVSRDIHLSDSSAFVNVDKQQCTDSSESSNKDSSTKERNSPISSDSKSDLVKIGSDRTSGHTSGDELETTTSSDIEIIPSPNGDNGHGFCRSSPAKYGFKNKFDGATSPNLVDLVLGKSLASKVRGHNRELSEASIQSNTSDESQGSENERLMRRLCEMTEVLEARENRLIEVCRSNTELAESNSCLKSQVESLLAKHEVADINTITEDYTQRMSALEKKFQQAIREKDQLRKQLDNLRVESSRKNSTEMEMNLKEKDEVIAQLQEEGEKLARQQLQHSNIIKKLRAKDKDNEQVIKGLRDKIAEQTTEIERLKRSIAAKEEVEVTQIEAVYRLTTANKKLEAELMETKSALDDATQKLEASRQSLEAGGREVAEAARARAALTAKGAALAVLTDERDAARREQRRLADLLHASQCDRLREEQRWAARVEALRREASAAREACAALEAGATGEGAGGGGGASGEGAGALLAQLAALQHAAVQRDAAHAHAHDKLRAAIVEAETATAKAIERERLSREECAAAAVRLRGCEEQLQQARAQAVLAQHQAAAAENRADELQTLLHSKSKEYESVQASYEGETRALRASVAALQLEARELQAALDTERKRYSILQEQMCVRGEESPPQSVASDSLSASLWHSEEGSMTPTYVPLAATVACDALAAAGVARRDGEAAARDAARLAAEKRALSDTVADLQAKLNHLQNLQEQYDALLQMYGEKEEQLEELRLDLQDVTQLYKQQLDELVALKQRAPR